MTNEQFYHACAEILNVSSLGTPFVHYKRTRWNNRKPGQGRFEGRGIIRCFGNQVHIALSTPPMHKIVDSKEEALETLSKMHKRNNTPVASSVF